jgi:hypothetical protein
MEFASGSCTMDSLYLTALQDDHLSLQQMMDDDLKREMDLDDCFSFGGDLPSLALDDSLDCKWEFVDNSTSGKNMKPILKLIVC